MRVGTPGRPKPTNARPTNASRPRPCPPGAVVAALAISLLAAVGAGCASRPSDPLTAAGDAYRSAEYGRAATLARRAGEGASGAARDRANYLEGIALLQLGRIDDAAPLLFAASGSTDASVAADARITLGTAEIRRGDLVSAGRAYRRAAEVLEGSDKARAAAIAERCFARAKSADPFPSREAASSARDGSGAGSGTGRETGVVAPGPAGVRFAIQAGAFSDERRADEVAATLASRVAGLGIGSPRVFAKRRTDGSTVHVVQVGSFLDRVTADRTLRAFSKDGYTIERAGP